MYKLEQQNLSANDTKYCEFQENVAIGLVTDSDIIGVCLKFSERIKVITILKN